MGEQLHYVDLRFFQAGAVIIPTLFIAFAITSKVLEVNTSAKNHLPLLSNSKLPNILYAAAIALLFAAAEMVCLATLATGAPTRLAMLIVVGSMSLMIWVICYQSLIPALEAHSQAIGVLLFIAPFLLILGAFFLAYGLLGGSL